MTEQMIKLDVAWKPIRFSRYWRGVVLKETSMQARMAVDRIYKRNFRISDQIRIYSGMNLDGVYVLVNDDKLPRRMRSRGRFGRLYIEES